MAIQSRDLQFIKQQLGRTPRGVLGVNTRCKNCPLICTCDIGRHWQANHPLVIKTKPIIDREIFPTLYYLVCGKMIKKVLQLESEGFIGKLQRKIDEEKNFKIRFLKIQNAYREERNSLLNTAKLSMMQKEALNSGIGGVKKLDRIKCLHCHLAHYLATGNNPVGKEVAKVLVSSQQ